MFCSHWSGNFYTMIKNVKIWDRISEWIFFDLFNVVEIIIQQNIVFFNNNKKAKNFCKIQFFFVQYYPCMKSIFFPVVNMITCFIGVVITTLCSSFTYYCIKYCILKYILKMTTAFYLNFISIVFKSNVRLQ